MFKIKAWYPTKQKISNIQQTQICGVTSAQVSPDHRALAGAPASGRTFYVFPADLQAGIWPTGVANAMLVVGELVRTMQSRMTALIYS